MSNTFDEVVLRLGRIYAAFGVTIEKDISKFPAKVGRNDRASFMWQDFRGGLSNEDLLNLAYSLVQNIFNLRDHLRGWARANDSSDEDVMEFFKASKPLRIIADLANADKHGYPPKYHWTDTCPKLGEVTRPLQLTAKPGAGWSGITLGADGRLHTFGQAEAQVVLSVDVLDKNGNKIGDLVEIAKHAVRDWEKLAVDFGIIRKKE